MLTISLAGFCINDIFDQEMDRINHPGRALASYPALSSSVLSLYVVLFLVTLCLILLQDSSSDRFIWAISFILLSNYSAFKRYSPSLKNAYMAATACVVFSILDGASEHPLPIIIRYGPLFVANFAREVLLDIPDRRGDKNTLVSRLRPKRSLYLALSLCCVSLCVTMYFSTTMLELTMVIVGFLSLFCYVVARLKVGLKGQALRPLAGIMATVPAILIIK
jgi:4-hydroxybenzoate polyprenyltransferase